MKHELVQAVPLEQITPQLSDYLNKQGLKARVIEYKSDYSNEAGIKYFVVMAKEGRIVAELGHLITVIRDDERSITYHGVLPDTNSFTKNSQVFLHSHNGSRNDGHTSVPFP